jgi:hypothetical protein
MHLASVLEAEDGWMDELGARTRSRAQFNAVLDFWEMLLARPAAAAWLPDAERDAFLRATLVFPTWRDAVLVMAAAGRRAAEAGAEQFGVLADGSDPGASGNSVVSPPLAPPATLRGTSSLTSPGCPAAGYGEVLMGVAPEVPDWASLDMLDRVLEQLAAPGGRAAAAALTGRGWVAWCRGRGSYSAAYLGEALQLEPGYRLAELLLDLVGRGTLCGWAARKEAAWQKFREDPLAPGGGAVGGH